MRCPKAPAPAQPETFNHLGDFMSIKKAAIKTTCVIEHFDMLEIEVFDNVKTAQALFRAIADRSKDEATRCLARHGESLMMMSSDDAEEALHAIAVHCGCATAH